MSNEERKVPNYDEEMNSFDIMGDDGYEETYFPRLMLFNAKVNNYDKELFNLWINLSHLEIDGDIDHYCYLTLVSDEFVTPKNAAYVNTEYCPFTDQLLQTGIADDIGERKVVDGIDYHLWIFKEEFLEGLHSEYYEEYSKAYDEFINSLNPEPEETEEQEMNLN